MNNTRLQSETIRTRVVCIYRSDDITNKISQGNGVRQTVCVTHTCLKVIFTDGLD
jgi:hypothetical protein